MKSSSARQKEPEFADSGTEAQAQVISQRDALDGGEVKDASSATSNFSFPNIGIDNSLFAAAARRAGRLNAANASSKEIEDLLGERQRLLDKQFAKTITREEQLRLQYVRWNLDRIEDAKFGSSLDVLEDWVVQYEKFKNDIENLQKDLSKHLKGKRR